MKDVFESHTVAYLKKEISNFKNIIKGYSKLKKTEIVELMLSYSNFFSYIKKNPKVIMSKRPYVKLPRPAHIINITALTAVAVRIFSLEDIRHNESICKKYLQSLPTNIPLQGVINYAHSACPQLSVEVESKKHLFNAFKRQDKGNIGKIVEFYLFGQLPNCTSKPDLPWGSDIKTTHFKKNKNGHLNAKYRLTITNCGKTGDYATFSPIQEAVDLKSSKYYPKIKNGVIFIFEHTSGKYHDVNTNLQKHLLAVSMYNTEELPTDFQEQLQLDFQDIQQKITDKAVSQTGQKYLHIHTHGSKNSSTRALGFTNKFLTKLVAYTNKLPVTTKGRSVYIEKQHF